MITNYIDNSHVDYIEAEACVNKIIFITESNELKLIKNQNGLLDFLEIVSENDQISKRELLEQLRDEFSCFIAFDGKKNDFSFLVKEDHLYSKYYHDSNYYDNILVKTKYYIVPFKPGYFSGKILTPNSFITLTVDEFEEYLSDLYDINYAQREHQTELLDVLTKLRKRDGNHR